MTIDNTNTNYKTFTETTKKVKIYISKDILQEAKNANNHPNRTAVIFNNQVMAIENERLGSLKNEFKNEFKKYEDILIATNGAESYLSKISNYVLNDLNVSNADENKDGMITIDESLDVKNIVNQENNTIEKPKDVLPINIIKIMENDTSNFMSVNDILNLHIQLDENKDGKVSLKEINQESNINSSQSKQTSSSDSKNILDQLYEKLEKLQKQISSLSSKMASANEQETQMLSDQIDMLNGQVGTILGQILKILDEQDKAGT